MGRKPKVSKEVKIKSCKDYDSGFKSTYEIADELGVTKESVCLQ